MRLAKVDKTALATTVGAAGFDGSVDDLVCMAFSPADAESNRLVHAKTNEQLLATLMKNTPGHCIHVTGEMRALADPYHRRLCAELAKRAATRFIVLYDIPDDYSGSPEGVGKWNSKRWTSKSWSQRLSAINLIGEAFVDVRAFNTLGEIQYSVFGNRYVQIQEKHVDEGTAQKAAGKRVWLLDSEKLNAHLTSRALNMVSKSKDVPEALFKRFFAKVSGVTARNILAKLAETESVRSEDLVDKDMLDFDPEASGRLLSLQDIGFVKADQQNRLFLTAEGRQFSETLR